MGARRLKWVRYRDADVGGLVQAELVVLVDRKRRPVCALHGGLMPARAGRPGPTWVPALGHYDAPDGAYMAVCRTCGRAAAAEMRRAMPGDWNVICTDPDCEEHR